MRRRNLLQFAGILLPISTSTEAARARRSRKRPRSPIISPTSTKSLKDLLRGFAIAGGVMKLADLQARGYAYLRP